MQVISSDGMRGCGPPSRSIKGTWCSVYRPGAGIRQGTPHPDQHYFGVGSTRSCADPQAHLRRRIVVEGHLMQLKNLFLAQTFFCVSVFALPSTEAVQSATRAHDAKFDEAARQAAQAQQIDPTLGFTDPEKFRNFEQLLRREQGQAHPMPSRSVAGRRS
jgi:hypothetical protein